MASAKPTVMTDVPVAAPQTYLTSVVTALLLSIELALEAPGLPAAAAEKLQSVYELVKKLRKQLESADPTGEPEPAAGV